MKFRKKQLKLDSVGQIRNRDKFLWWPARVDEEWWWLESVRVTEAFMQIPILSSVGTYFTGGGLWYSYDWVVIDIAPPGHPGNPGTMGG